MNIPVIVNNRDLQVSSIVSHLYQMTAGEIHIIDNASTFPELLKFLDTCERDGGRIHVHRWQNTGPRAACRLVHQMRSRWIADGHRYYATTDSDLDLRMVPRNVLSVCAEVLEAFPQYVKVGCALRLDDLPETAEVARQAEAGYWARDVQIVLRDGSTIEAFEADIDTTFAVYRLDPPWDGSYGPAIRLAGDYQARHLPWYHTEENRPADYRWYLDRADPAGTFYTARELANGRT